MATTIEIGKCSQCGENNVKKFTNCRKCDALLPWAKVEKVKKTAKPVTSGDSGGGIKSSLDEIDWGSTGISLLGGFIFLAGIFLWCGNKFGFFPTIPGAGWATIIIGSALWGYGLQRNS